MLHKTALLKTRAPAWPTINLRRLSPAVYPFPMSLWSVLVLLVACSGSDNSTAAISAGEGEVITPIGMIQGAAGESPLVGQRLVITGIVTGDFQSDDSDRSRDLGGFFVQEKVPDESRMTSDGIFVFDRNAAMTDVSPGDEVTVSGTVVERFGETQFTADQVVISGEGAVAPLLLALPAGSMTNSDGDTIINLERYEGMLVQLADPATITDVFHVERFGELTLSGGGRLFQFTNSFAPDVAGYATHSINNASMSIILDDGIARQNVASKRYVNRSNGAGGMIAPRVGDSVTKVVGNIRYSRGSGPAGKESYRIVPTEEPQFEHTNPRESLPPAVGGRIKVASFNVLNYFTTIDNGQDRCGPQGDQGCRGADSPDELERQHAKIVNTLIQLDADVVGLMELENNGGAALQKIVGGLNQLTGEGVWNFVNTGVVGTDAISVGFIYRVDRVRPTGRFAVLTSAVTQDFDADKRFDDQKNRPPIAQSFESLDNNGRFTIAVNHLKSKGSPCDELNDPNTRDGQANCNLTRTRAAAALADWLSSDPTGSDDADFLIIGDLNAYLKEDPLAALESAGFVNLLPHFSDESAYSFVFEGQSGALDHALASRAMFTQITGVAEWNINADEPPLFDYNLEFERAVDLFDPTHPYRASDHDPIIIGINP